MMRNAALALLMLGLILAARSAEAEAPPAPGYSAAGLYNLANFYARSGKPGMAVLNYERAALLAPNDPDIEANLRLISAASRVPIEQRNPTQRTLSLASPRLLAWLGPIGLILVGLSWLAGRMNARYRTMRRAAALVGIALVALIVANGVLIWPKLHQGVVIAAATKVRVAPVPMGEALFELPEAEIVKMTAQHEGFVLIHTRAGRTGWVARANLAPIVPRD